MGLFPCLHKSFGFWFRGDDVILHSVFGLFGCIGNVVEVSIAPIRNKREKFFGFARFKDVEDSRVLAILLDIVQIGGSKIHANEPKFERTSLPVHRTAGG